MNIIFPNIIFLYFPGKIRAAASQAIALMRQLISVNSLANHYRSAEISFRELEIK